MTSKETDLRRFKKKVRTQTKFFCLANNFIVFKDQNTLLGVECEWEKTANRNSNGMIELKY